MNRVPRSADVEGCWQLGSKALVPTHVDSFDIRYLFALIATMLMRHIREKQEAVETAISMQSKESGESFHGEMIHAFFANGALNVAKWRFV